MSDVLNQRKEKIFTFIRNNSTWLQYFILAIVVWIGWYIRKQPISRLIDVTTGKYISIELDSTLYLRYAEYIAEHGKLFAIDYLRYSPIGANVDITVFSSYFVAYTYRILKFIGFDYSVQLVNNYYPLIATAILTVFLFLFIKKSFDWRVGLLSAFIINIMPAFLFRSMGGSSDHDILALMFLVMAFYFYLTAIQSKKFKFNVLFGAIVGLIAVLGLNTAGSINFFFMAASLFILIEIVFEKFSKNDFAVLASFLITFTILIISLGANSFSGLAMSFTTGLFYIDFAVALFYFYIYNNKKFSSFIEKYNFIKKIPPGAFSFIICFIILMIFAFVFFGAEFMYHRLSLFLQTLFKSFSLTRWVLTVAENRRPYVEDWIGSFGKIAVWMFMLGSIALFYDAIKKAKRVKQLTIAYAIFIFLYVFSRYSGSSVLNGESRISNILFFGSLVSFGLFILIYYFYTYSKDKEEFDFLRSFDKKHALLLVWSVVMILIATTAIRFLFEFSLIIAILVSYFIIFLFDYLKDLKDKNILLVLSLVLGFVFFNIVLNIKTLYEVLIGLVLVCVLIYLIYFREKDIKFVNYISFLFIILILLSPFAFAKGLLFTYYETSLNSAKFSGVGYDTQWQYAGKWVRENTPTDAVFAHWWDYGYWVQSGFQRKTVTDGGNFYGWWNYLMGRNVLTSTTDSEALGYLYAHNTSYVLAVSDEIGKYPAYSSIGSDSTGDRISFIPTFTLDPSLAQKTRNETLYIFKGAFSLDDDVKYNGQIIPKGAFVAGVVVPTVTSSDGNSVLMQPKAIVIYNNKQFELTMRCIYLDKNYEFSNYNYGGCLRLLPLAVDDKMSNFAVGLFLSEKISKSFIGRYYLLNHKSDMFELVYDDTIMGVPLSIYQGRQVGPIRIWKINYPKNFSITEEQKEYYLSTTFKDQNLMVPL